MNNANSRVEISRSALIHNLKQFKKIVGPKVQLLLPIKANAYGHGLIEVAVIAKKNGADWFGVNALEEAELLHRKRINQPTLILGYLKLNQLYRLKRLNNVRLAVYNETTIKKLGQLKNKVKVHLKLETGTVRQGVLPKNIVNFSNLIKRFPNIQIEGIYTHFANIEDTTSHQFAFKQLKIFNQTVKLLEQRGFDLPIKHAACSAATILFRKTHFNLVRPGISCYGLWSSKETCAAAQKKHRTVFLKPVLSWKTITAQIKEVEKNSTIGYGRTEKVFRNTNIAIIPVGYWDGYDRGLSSIGNVLIQGRRAKVVGRVCMNIFMVDVTDIKNAKVEDEVVLLGKQGKEEITAEEMADKLNTINYEVVTRINPLIERRVVD